MKSTEPAFSFCLIDLTRIIAANDPVLAIMDGFTISPGHALVISKRHIASLLNLSFF